MSPRVSVRLITFSGTSESSALDLDFTPAPAMSLQQDPEPESAHFAPSDTPMPTQPRHDVVADSYPVPAVVDTTPPIAEPEFGKFSVAAQDS